LNAACSDDSDKKRRRSDLRMTIRPFQPADMPTIRQIAVDAFEGVSIDQGIESAFGPINGHDWQWRKGRHIDEDARRAPEGIFVAVDEQTGAVAGFVSSWRDDEAAIGFIPNISIASGHRGKGIGRALLEHVLEDFRRHGLTHARIETLVQNEVGYGLYTSLGFREVARQVHFALDLNAPPRETSSPVGDFQSDQLESAP
jgi:ribosomal protein S18 acetylase RimI-like enzyme